MFVLLEYTCSQLDVIKGVRLVRFGSHCQYLAGANSCAIVFLYFVIHLWRWVLVVVRACLPFLPVFEVKSTLLSHVLFLPFWWTGVLLTREPSQFVHSAGVVG